MHVNAATFGFIPFGDLGEEELASLTEVERARVARMKDFLGDGNGYFAEQSTRPQTVSYGLSDSPVGQLAWIIGKFKEWTDSAYGLPRRRRRTRAPAHERLGLLVHQHLRERREHLLREHPQPRLADAHDDSHGCGGVLRGYRHPPLQRSAVQHRALERFRARRTLRGARAPDLFVGDVREFFSGIR